MDRELQKVIEAYPWLTYLFVIFFSCWGGLVNIIQRYKTSRERKFSVMEAIGELIISAFAGMLVFYLCSYFNINGNLMAGLVGIAGHMGSRGIYMIETAVRERLAIYLDSKKAEIKKPK